MFKKAIYSLLFIIILFGLSFSFSQAQSGNALDGLNTSAGQIDAFKNQTSAGSYNDFLQTKAGQIIGLALSFVGVIFLVLMIYAGIMWMTAQGNDQQVGKAKNLLINAIIGLVIVFAAYAITTFIGSEILR